ncbi:hypothetical protein SUGI_1196030 [Cryptomeria japonica]|nr:hypothetical protein SUGI_1196030 [Cryptomeria japonica]
MAALDGSRINTGDRSRVTDVRYSGAQSSKVGSWRDEANIAFPIETGRLQVVQKPVNAGKADMVQGNRFSRSRLNFGNPYSNGNQCPIDLHKWKENGFVRLSIPHLRLPKTGIHRLILAFPVQHPREAILTMTLFWFPRLITVIPKRVMGTSGNTTQGWTKPGFGDPISALTIGTLGRATKDTLTFEEQPPSLSDPAFINRLEKPQDPPSFWMRIKLILLGQICLSLAFSSSGVVESGLRVTLNPGVERNGSNFNPRTYVLSDNKVWIRLYNCPLDYWHIDVIKDMCKDLGTFVSTKDILEDKLWGSFLKICISMDHITKIPNEVRIIGAGKIWIQKIDREDQLHTCPKYFSLDHTGISCDVLATIQ